MLFPLSGSVYSPDGKALHRLSEGRGGASCGLTAMVTLTLWPARCSVVSISSACSHGIPAQDDADDQKQQGGQDGAGHLPLAELLGEDQGMIEL